jgi:hypothetical protein
MPTGRGPVPSKPRRLGGVASTTHVASAEGPQSTRRGSPRPATSVRAVTGDYAKADDNELPRDASTRRPTSELAMVAVTSGAERSRVAAPPPARADDGGRAAAPRPAANEVVPDRVRQAWLQGAMAGALVLAVAWLSLLIAKT